jgi:hypothetical protein
MSVNGIFKDIIYITYTDKYHVPLDCKVEIIEHNDISKTLSIINKYQESKTIIIDYMCYIQIIFATLRYGEYVLVFNKNKVINIYQFYISYFQISPNIINIELINLLCLFKIICFMYNLNFSVNEVLKIYNTKPINSTNLTKNLINYLHALYPNIDVENKSTQKSELENIVNIEYYKRLCNISTKNISVKTIYTYLIYKLKTT